MKCPKCGGKTKVLNSRSPKRKRKCSVCGYGWITTEVPMDEYLELCRFHNVIMKCANMIGDKQ